MARDREKTTHPERGANLVEMALILPLLLLLIAAIADFGRAFNAYIVITNAAREGARYAARVDHTRTVVDDFILCAIYQEAINSGIGLGTCPTPGKPEQTPEQEARSSITLDPAFAARSANNPISITISYTMPTFFTGIVGLDSITMRSQTTMVLFSETQAPPEMPLD